MFNFKLQKVKIRFNQFILKLKLIKSKYILYRNKLDAFLTNAVIQLARYIRKFSLFGLFLFFSISTYILKYHYKKLYPHYYGELPLKYRNGQCWIDYIPPLDEFLYKLNFRFPIKFNYMLHDVVIKIPKDVDCIIKTNFKIQINDLEDYNYILVFKNLPVYKVNLYENLNFKINLIHSFNSFQSPIVYDELELFFILMYSAVTKEPSMLADILHQKFIKFSFFSFFYF